MNLSFSLTSFFLYSHSFSLGLRGPIHFSVLSFFFSVSLQYWSDIIVSLCRSLNFSLSTSNNPELILHFCCSLQINVWTNMHLSWPSQFHLLLVLPVLLFYFCWALCLSYQYYCCFGNLNHCLYYGLCHAMAQYHIFLLPSSSGNFIHVLLSIFMSALCKTSFTSYTM